MKILMALMGLEIGGAETHVVELSKALHKKGYEVVVASNGGVYQTELEQFGIRHVRIPLHSKKPWRENKHCPLQRTRTTKQNKTIPNFVSTGKSSHLEYVKKKQTKTSYWTPELFHVCVF